MKIQRGAGAAREALRLSQRAVTSSGDAERVAARIIAGVRRNGDRALRSYGERFDGLGRRQALRVSGREMQEAARVVSNQFRGALERAAGNIRRFCEWQMPREFRRVIEPGIEVGQMVRPLESVGCYVPGGRYPLPSSLLMTVIPAQVARVRRIAVASPHPAAETLAAAAMLGVEEFYRLGGAQAIAAFAYGTKTVPRTQKIVGPGNRFVTAAKKLVAFDCAIDMLAGPTEIVYVAQQGEAKFIAADLMAQAEHDPDTTAVFITTSGELAKAVAAEISQSPDDAPAVASLRRQGAILLAESREQAMEWANAIAPEHITVAAEDLAAVQNAGSVFVGEYSAQALGDYASGPNHVLPTGGVARFRGGLSVNDYVKLITVQEVSRSGLEGIAATVETLAKAEGLEAHAASVRVRCAHA